MLRKEVGSGYNVTVPAMPGCFSDGASIDASARKCVRGTCTPHARDYHCWRSSLRRKTLMRISPTLNVRAVFGPWVISISFQASGHQYRSASLCMSTWCKKLISKWEKIATINRALTFFVAATLRVLGVQRCWGRYRSVLELTSKAPQKNPPSAQCCSHKRKRTL